MRYHRARMSATRKVFIGIGIWIAAITALHLAMNVEWSVVLNERLPLDQRKMNVAYIPVT